MNKRLIGVIAGLALAAGAAAGYFMTPESRPSDTRAAASTAAGFRLPDLEGIERSHAEWAGQVVLVNFWAPWCPPCRREIPALIELQEKYRDQGLVVAGIAVDTVQNTQDFVDASDINFPILVGEEQGIEISRSYGNRVNALPFTVVLDRNGAAQYTHRSEITLEQAEQAIAPYL